MKAILVTTTLVTRVIVEDDATEDSIIEASRENFAYKIANDLHENIDSIIDDDECPFSEDDEIINLLTHNTMKNQNEQPKMYKLLTQKASDRLTKGEIYPSDHHFTLQNDWRKVELDVFLSPQDWQLVEPENQGQILRNTHEHTQPEHKPFTPTHLLTTGRFNNTPVYAVCHTIGKAELTIVAVESGAQVEVESRFLTPISPTKTHLSESQYSDLIKRIADEINFAVVWEVSPKEYKERAETAVREWAQNNQIELP